MKRPEVQDDHYMANKFMLVPLEFCRDGYYRTVAKITCKKCGKQFDQFLRHHRIRNEFGIQHQIPDPHEEIMAIKFIMNAHKHHDTRCVVMPMDFAATRLESIDGRPQ